MKLPVELEDHYLKEVLCNTSLENLPDEEWKLIDGLENYAISNYGRVKSLEREVSYSDGRKQKLPERVMKLQVMKQYNGYLNSHFYNIRCLFSHEGKKYGKYMARLVYYHFVEKFDLNDHSIIISYKDNNRFHIHRSNLEKLSVREGLFKRYQTDRIKNHRSNYGQAVNQYTVEGKFVAAFESINEASDRLGIGCRNIFTVIKKAGLTAGGFRWFLKEYTPTKEDFIPTVKNNRDSSGKIFNETIWKKLGNPTVNKNNPPAVMNLSLEDLADEEWKPIPGLEQQYSISNKGRIKSLNTWTSNKAKSFFRERIISQTAYIHPDNKAYFHTVLSHNGNYFSISVTRLLYYCFVEKFDLSDKKLVVVNQNDPSWDLDISLLILCPSSSVFIKKTIKKE
jgi:hypothetical protein